MAGERAYLVLIVGGRVIGLSGSLAFPAVAVGQTASRTLTIANSGSGTLTVTGITYPAGFSGPWSGTIAGRASQAVSVIFDPTAAGLYSGAITVTATRPAERTRLRCRVGDLCRWSSRTTRFGPG